MNLIELQVSVGSLQWYVNKQPNILEGDNSMYRNYRTVNIHLLNC